jgi:hypothetical protein
MTNPSNIFSGLKAGKNLKQFLFLITKEIQFVSHHNRVAEWDAHFALRQNMVSGEI